jgi:ubiquinone/menaquinone biosynthesis methyltransferase
MTKHNDLPEAGKTQDSETHFGFRNVASSEKSGLVRGVFDSVASRYDIMNDLMSAGLHRLWKNALIDELDPKPGMRLLDVAGGTGDIAFRFLERSGKQSGEAKADVIVCDINASMLTVGRKRAAGRGFRDQLSWVCGDAELLPVKTHATDAYTIAFGIRNVTHIEKALAEAYRALKPGGRFLCLEFSQVALPLLAPLYEAYSFRVIPKLGQMITGDGEAYQYLVESIRRFPAQEKFARLIEAAGFSKVRYRNMSGGVVALHSGWRI